MEELRNYLNDYRAEAKAEAVSMLEEASSLFEKYRNEELEEDEKEEIMNSTIELEDNAKSLVSVAVFIDELLERIKTNNFSIDFKGKDKHDENEEYEDDDKDDDKDEEKYGDEEYEEDDEEEYEDGEYEENEDEEYAEDNDEDDEDE